MNAMMKKAFFHPISSGDQDALVIHGFEGTLDNGCLSIVAYGDHFLEYGIADNSLLVCSMTVEPQEGDIVIHFDGARPVAYLFQPDSDAECDEENRLLHDAGQVDAVVLGSFNFYR